MSKYVFITNSTKPSREDYESLDNIKLDNVSRPCLKIAKELGYEVILGVNRKNTQNLKCDEIDISFYNSHTFRNIFAIKDNYKAYRNLCKVLEKGDVDVIHCNSPIGGFIGRICGRKYRVSKVIYTAHGFHFYKGAPFFNNTILKMIEHILARWTDVIITLNEEDYQSAKKMKLKKGGSVYKINGVGINTTQYEFSDKLRKNIRNELGINQNSFVGLMLGRLDKNKNYLSIIEALYKIKNQSIHILICGEGKQDLKLKMKVKAFNLQDNIHFLGYRKDIAGLMSTADFFMNLSFREGLPRSTMEAMASGLPCIVSNVRGNKDLIKNYENGFVISSDTELIEKIKVLMKDKNLRLKFKMNNLTKIKSYDLELIERKIYAIYVEHINK